MCSIDRRQWAAPGYEMPPSCPQLSSDVLLGKFIQISRAVEVDLGLLSAPYALGPGTSSIRSFTHLFIHETLSESLSGASHSFCFLSNVQFGNKSHGFASLAYSPPTQGAPSLAGPGVAVCSTSRPTLPEVGTWEGFEEGGKKGKDCFRDSMARAQVYCGTMSVGDGSGPVLGPRGVCFGGVDTEVNKMR